MEITLELLQDAMKNIWSRIAPDAEEFIDDDPAVVVEICFDADRMYTLGLADTLEISRAHSSAALGEFNSQLCDFARTMI